MRRRRTLHPLRLLHRVCPLGSPLDPVSFPYFDYITPLWIPSRSLANSHCPTQPLTSRLGPCFYEPPQVWQGVTGADARPTQHAVSGAAGACDKSCTVVVDATTLFDAICRCECLIVLPCLVAARALVLSFSRSLVLSFSRSRSLPTCSTPTGSSLSNGSVHSRTGRARGWRLSTSGHSWRRGRSRSARLSPPRAS